jgi:hypothetical protein
MYSLSIRFKNLDAVERIRIPFGSKSLTILSNNRQYVQPPNGIKSISIEFAIGGGACKVMHYSCNGRYTSLIYRIQVNTTKIGGAIFYGFYIQNSNDTNTYASDAIINYNLSYVEGDTTYFSNNQTIIIPAGSNAVGTTIDNSDGVTKTTITIISITPSNIQYTGINQAYF